ncbi:transcriptional regulator [Alkalilimnicola ehrlichii]|uniref:Transcriptional regulator n=1 Tax=Alkalilimnicola ehrlichii TaxID=351052 RepID=A0A3E0WL68_9GAMM|nr:helix-turn-helix transcriptional regulator [Alkalilimnicola ehrlichii]RFA25569.1 transcriptional regulator [Alkalilimnicola ehrlichii]RFA32726.1 transcriptional regulator [Alkalilimnicola ehrlichii]
MINHIRAHRKARGLTQAELAAAMGVSRNTINSIEVGRYVPSLALALALARFFGKHVEELFDDREQ